MSGCKTIAEYAVKKWMKDNGFVMDWFTVTMNGNEAEITDRTGDKMIVCYEPKTKSVNPKEQEKEK